MFIDASGIHAQETNSSSDVIKSEPVIAPDNFYDESEYQEELDNDVSDDDPVDTIVNWHWDNAQEEPPTPIKKTNSTKKYISLSQM